VAKKKKGGVPELSEDEAKLPARPPERIARPFADALAGVKPAPKAPPAAKPGTARSFTEALAARRDAAKANDPAGTPATPGPTPPAQAEPERPRTFSEALEIRTRAASPEAKAAERSLADRTALHNAFAGVTPLGARDQRRVARLTPGAAAPIPRGALPDLREVDDAARKRLDALVADAVHFEITDDTDGTTRGAAIDRGGRRAMDTTALAQLARETPDAVLDLHGKTGDEAETLLARWLRQQQRAGARTVRVVHGKGLHSEGGLPVLRDRVVHALTEGGAAPLVRGFASCDARGGGTGALMVRLATPR
jgi:DNA-nicking Smr family endonuclease